MNIKQTNNGVFQMRITQISENRMILYVDNYGLARLLQYQLFWVARKWLGLFTGVVPWKLPIGWVACERLG